MPISETRKYKDTEGVGQLISEVALSLQSWMVKEERESIRLMLVEKIKSFMKLLLKV